MRDRRYTINREHCGYPSARYVVRFCGAWVGSSGTRKGAMRVAREHAAMRQRILAGGVP